jgi:hypothetical protein
MFRSVPLSRTPPRFPLSSRPGFPVTQHWTRSRMRLSLKERRIRSVSAKKFHRKSGGAQPSGSAVRPSQSRKPKVAALPLLLLSPLSPSRFSTKRRRPVAAKPRKDLQFRGPCWKCFLQGTVNKSAFFSIPHPGQFTELSQSSAPEFTITNGALWYRCGHLQVWRVARE